MMTTCKSTVIGIRSFKQGWEFAFSLFEKEQQERIALVALYF